MIVGGLLNAQLAEEVWNLEAVDLALQQPECHQRVKKNPEFREGVTREFPEFARRPWSLDRA